MGLLRSRAATVLLGSSVLLAGCGGDDAPADALDDLGELSFEESVALFGKPESAAPYWHEDNVRRRDPRGCADAAARAAARARGCP